MKRAMRILVPILLIFTILFSIGWYLFRYDPDFTRDFLVNQARRAEEKGNHSRATRLYELAYRHSGNDKDVAIELANQFCAIGNYTKAEYTLSHAIADGGSLDLYIALCQTYVKQDKLLDAVTMLDNVSDVTIKAQLDALRPAAPTADMNPGFYNNYISVSLTGTDGTILATTDGQYPSCSTPYNLEPIVLPGGETVIQALTINDQGLVSPLTILGYTVAGVVEPVTLSDPAIDQAVRQHLQVSDAHVLYSNELWNITFFSVPAEATSLEDLRLMPYLQRLIIRGHSGFESLSPLESLSQLQELVISDCPLEPDDLTSIAKVPKLSVLDLSSCGLSNITPLSAATNLVRLDLHDNSIRDLTALQQMAELNWLDLSNNAVTAVDALGQLPKLSELYLSNNSITQIQALSGCTGLSVLDLTHNLLTTVSGLEKLPSLRTLYLANNQLTDITPLSSTPAIGDLNISNNQITDIRCLASLTNLVLLDFSYNQATELPMFASGHPLVSVKGTHNQITSLEPLAGLQQLNRVNMEQNVGIDSVTPLVDCPVLVEVNVFGTAVTDVSCLTDNNRNVIVKYSPL